MKRLRSLLPLLALLLLVPVAVPPRAAQAQNGDGNNSVEFWDDPSVIGFALPNPTTAEGEGTFYINPSGGRTIDDGLFVMIKGGRIQIIRDRDSHIFGGYFNPSMMWLVTTNIDGTDYCFTLGADMWRCRSDLAGAGYTAVDFTVSSTRISDLKVRTTYVGAAGSVNLTLTVDYTYDPARKWFVKLEPQISFSDGAARSGKIYLVSDMYLDGEDSGPGVKTTYEGRSVIAQIGPTAVGGFLTGAVDFASYMVDDSRCVYGAPTFFGTPICDGSLTEPTRGPGAGEPYPNVVNPNAETDIGLGAQWDWSTGAGKPSKKLATELIFTSKADWENLLANDPGPPTDPTEEDTTPAFCQQPPTLAIKPDPLEIAPGGAATVWVELTNPCRDLPTAPVDVLLSLSDGLTVIETSQGVLNLGQRAALQRFSLDAGATHGWYAIVRASDPFVTAPLAVAELYAGAAVVRTDTKSFTTPAAAPAPAPAPAAPAPAPAPAEPAALPVTLPNTAGAALPLGLLAVSAAAAVILGRRIGRR